ncbi:MAG TPA: class I SAM-dependent methyltransferase [Candidatus Kapabacteria bacterium]|nr:class I SAM-dependent methyltransferase [Candidatus Kapabacteria bacterium]
MRSTEKNAISSLATSTSFPLLVQQIVGELTQATSYAQVCYLMGRILGARYQLGLQGLTPEQIEQVRNSLQPLCDESHAWHWAFSKPYGYPGDYMVLEYAYENVVRPESSPVGQLLDRWLMDSQLAGGVRERKDMLAAFIERKASAHHQITGQPLKVLSLASGSARELREQTPAVLAKLDVLLIDQDPRSLDYAAQHLPPTVQTWKTNALRLKPADMKHPFDLVYSFGFFDYLKDEVIVHCLNLCRDVLAPGGSIIFPLKMNSKYRHWFYDVFLDWRFVKRELEDGMRLAAQAGLDVVELLETANESVVFYHCVPRQM